MRLKAYRFAVESGATELSAWLKRRRATILTYHGLTAVPPPPALRPLYKVMVTADEFRAQMQILRARYDVVPLEDLAGRLANGQAVERLAAVTFDDGWKTTRTLAAPILHDLQLPSTVFVATGLVGTDTRGLWTHRVWASLSKTTAKRIQCGELELSVDSDERRANAIRTVMGVLKRMSSRDRHDAVESILERYGPGIEMPEDMGFMSWDEVRELPKLGMSVGAHTVDHEILSRLDAESVRDQVRRSKLAIERETGAPCQLFAYPNGSAEDFTEEHARILKDEGFTAAVTQIPGRNSPLADAFKLKRLNVGLEHSRQTFIAELDGLRHWT